MNRLCSVADTPPQGAELVYDQVYSSVESVVLQATSGQIPDRPGRNARKVRDIHLKEWHVKRGVPSVILECHG